MRNLTWLLLLPAMVSAANIVIDPELSFGTIAISDYYQNGSLVVSQSTGVKSSGSILVVSPGHPAEVYLSDFPASTQLAIDFVSAPVEFRGDNGIAQQALWLRQLEHPDIIYTDSVGSAAFKVGGTLYFEGQGSAITDGTNTVTISININY